MRDFDADWNQIWTLDNQVQRGLPLALTDELCDLLRRTAPTVAISSAEVDAALASAKLTTALLQDIAARIREGSHRLSRALDRMYTREEKGDLDGARQQMQDLLAIEKVPHYRSIAEGQLERLDDLT
ncbi:DUSAM domain-containing protein [Pyxidicoccus trucidator]|uniref:DUSAM domain-containing protein n=1 Tax=Pyxidicoccus trucidator TaxID=2709662 RepID=UPI0013D9FD97|nr:DUSAM domain-containing protein [Pyxidicoccus trucidator]